MAVDSASPDACPEPPDDEDASRLKAFAAFAFCAEMTRLPSHCDAGVLPENADAFIKECRDTYQFDIAGVMSIPPFDEAPAPHFALTAKIAERNGLKLLSMGMSADFPVAIAFGATHVRVGSAIFGSRPEL